MLTCGFRLDGRVARITGSARDIGRAIAGCVSDHHAVRDMIDESVTSFGSIGMRERRVLKIPL